MGLLRVKRAHFYSESRASANFSLDSGLIKDLIAITCARSLTRHVVARRIAHVGVSAVAVAVAAATATTLHRGSWISHLLLVTRVHLTSVSATRMNKRFTLLITAGALGTATTIAILLLTIVARVMTCMVVVVIAILSVVLEEDRRMRITTTRALTTSIERVFVLWPMMVTCRVFTTRCFCAFFLSSKRSLGISFGYRNRRHIFIIFFFLVVAALLLGLLLLLALRSFILGLNFNSLCTFISNFFLVASLLAFGRLSLGISLRFRGFSYNSFCSLN